MKQKLGLCCSLIHEPDLVILDEPTTGVDPLSRGQFWELIDRIRADRPGMSVMVSTAYMDEAERFDWLVAMFAGRVLATGTPKELMARTGTDSLDAAFIALMPEEQRQGHVDVVIPPRTGAASHEVVIEAEGSDPAVRQLHRRRPRQLPHHQRGNFRVPRLERLRQEHHHEDADGAPPSDRGHRDPVRPKDGRQRHEPSPARRLHVPGLLPLFGAHASGRTSSCTPVCTACRRTGSRAASPRRRNASTSPGSWTRCPTRCPWACVSVSSSRWR